MAVSSDVRDPEVVDLLQQMVRNACVNDGTEASGHEIANAELLRAGLEGSGCELETYEPLPGRTSLVARIEGSDAGMPALCYLGHTDVVSTVRFGAGAPSTC
jgi:acetylornithine deacetylase/succinyl-diaminopimelate desuccinylase-like protein